MCAALAVNYAADPLRAFDVGLLMAAMQQAQTPQPCLVRGSFVADRRRPRDPQVAKT